MTKEIRKTKFSELFWDKQGLSTVLCKDNPNLITETVRRAQRWENISTTSEFEIFTALVKNKFFNLDDCMTITDLFSLV